MKIQATNNKDKRQRKTVSKKHRGRKTTKHKSKPQPSRRRNNTMSTPDTAETENPGREVDVTQYSPMEETPVGMRSPPHVKRNIRKAGDINPTPERKNNANNGNESNHVTSGKGEPKSARDNKEPKRTRKTTQTLESFFKKLETKKQEGSQNTSVTEIMGKRTMFGKRLVPAGLTGKMRKEKAEKGRKEAEEADKGDMTKKTISFGTSDINNKPAPPRGSALKKGSKEKIKMFKHEMVVDVRVNRICATVCLG